MCSSPSHHSCLDHGEQAVSSQVALDGSGHHQVGTTLTLLQRQLSEGMGGTQKIGCDQTADSIQRQGETRINERILQKNPDPFSHQQGEKSEPTNHRGIDGSHGIQLVEH